jgi:hypothetical protein
LPTTTQNFPTNLPDYPVDFSVECETPGNYPHPVWTKQTDGIKIAETDGISDSGAEITAYFKKKGIKNAILTGVHANMCIINRSFGLRTEYLSSRKRLSFAGSKSLCGARA